MDGVVIEGNRLHDFRASPTSADHPDMIQFWTNGTRTPTRDVIIRDNVLDIGNGTATQSIFMRNDQVDRGEAGREMFYRNVTIEDNVIVNGAANGLVVGETDGLVVRNNTVLRGEGVRKDGVGASETPLIKIADKSVGVVIE
ncbi:right-handed parallel beta-helix repeat-containing protein, partial [Corallococcus praedator]